MTENIYCNTPKLYVVGTPIGNLQDMSPRAITILKSCDLILAEDTRHSIYLLQNFGIQTPLQSYHQHNESAKAQEIMQLLQQDKKVALITDAGMPSISDPGYYLIKLALENNLKISVIPGPSAVTAAISISGIDCSKFCFEGFLPSKDSAREKALSELSNEARAMVFYEAPHRLIKSLQSLHNSFGPERKIAVLKELTKQYEKIYFGSIAEVIEKITTNQSGNIKGEYVIVVAGNQQVVAADDVALISGLKTCLSEGLTNKQAVKIVSMLFKVNKNYVYELCLKLN